MSELVKTLGYWSWRASVSSSLDLFLGFIVNKLARAIELAGRVDTEDCRKAWGIDSGFDASAFYFILDTVEEELLSEKLIYTACNRGSYVWLVVHQIEIFLVRHIFSFRVW